MLFNSFDFLVFFLLFFCIYYLLQKKLKAQNLFLLVASYFFYGWWDWKFLSLILISSLCDFFIGKEIAKRDKKSIKRNLLAISVCINLGILGFFKYFNFFADSFYEFSTFIGFNVSKIYLDIILPVGISFYTFQTMSYTIDIYKGQMKPTKNLLNFMTFVSFFPQLVAGPIERASNLLPQFNIKRKISSTNFKEGLKQSIWGLFKKIVIADNCAVFANQIFENPEIYPGSMLFIGALMFTFQIYGDFSGYSDIAIGISRMLGFNLMQNFKSPYLALNIQDFWRRWHISLSTWFRDYLYIPIGGSKSKTTLRKYLNIFITFTVSGFWHGANWTFIIWGVLHSLFYMIQDTFVNKLNIKIPQTKFTKHLSIVLTFSSVVFAWIFFRAESVREAFYFIKSIFTKSIFSNPIPYFKQMGLSIQAIIILIALIYLAIFEFKNTNSKYSFIINTKNRFARSFVYMSLIFMIIFLRATNGAMDFIYFQF